MTCLSEILGKVNLGRELSLIENAMYFAYQAGRAEMRGVITEGIRDRVKSLEPHRFAIVQQKTVEHLVEIPELNNSFIFGFGGNPDSGSREAKELSEIVFEI